ncbi:hypothetical protein BRC83_05955 [Halobacteriales archaeon QS_1_68_17]|nr:MAG: hypothetical protein BRC83_05955 [Halobacteriales archaeon QS_1_68_17]
MGLAGVALVLLVGTFAVGAALAPAASSGATGRADNGTLVGIQGGGVGWHKYGSVVMYDGQGQERWRVDDTDSYFDVTYRENGTVLAGFMHGGYGDCGPYDSPCVHTGFRVLDPNASDPVTDEYGFPVRTQKNSEVHDVEELPSGEYLLTDMEYERIFTVVRNGTVTWQWNASSYYDAPDDPTRTDWLHINDVDVIGEDRYLVSVRNANQLLVIERGEGVVEVINENRDPDVLNHQHNPQWLGEGRVLVADSDNDRIVELQRNESGTWEVAWTRSEVGGVELTWPRDADRLPNGHTLITDTINKRIVEIDENGSVVWSVTTERIPYEADRVPVGERAGVGVDGRTTATGDGSVDRTPVLTPLLGLLRVSVPLPFWFAETHLAGVLASLALGAAGGVVWWRADPDG